MSMKTAPESAVGYPPDGCPAPTGRMRHRVKTWAGGVLPEKVGYLLFHDNDPACHDAEMLCQADEILHLATAFFAQAQIKRLEKK